MTVAEKYITEFNRLNGKKVYKSSLQVLLTKVKAVKSPDLKDVESRLEKAIAGMNGKPVILSISSPVKLPDTKPVKVVAPVKVSAPVVKKDPVKKEVIKTIELKPEKTKLSGIDVTLFQPINSIDKNKKKTFRLKGAIGELLGDMETYRLAITLEGDQGAGKTQCAFQLADAFADIGKSVGIFQLEIGANSNIVSKFRDKYIKPSNRKNVLIAGEAPNGINTVRDYAKKFNVIIIDSWTKLDVDSMEFDRLRKDFEDTIWVVLFQRTSGNTIRGGTKPLYDAGINLEAKKVDDTFVNNYVVATKNRYGATGIKYNIHARKITKEEAKKIESPKEKEAEQQPITPVQ